MPPPGVATCGGFSCNSDVRYKMLKLTSLFFHYHAIAEMNQPLFGRSIGKWLLSELELDR